MESFDSIPDLVEINSRILTAGQPSLAQLEAVADRGYRVVINLGLHTADYAIEDEAGWVEQLGLKYVYIPVDFTAPTLQDFTRYLNALNLHREKRCFIHCARNMRVLVFIALYQIIAGQLGPEQGWLHVNSIWEPDLTWTEFFQEVIQSFVDIIRNDPV